MKLGKLKSIKKLVVGLMVGVMLLGNSGITSYAISAEDFLDSAENDPVIAPTEVSEVWLEAMTSDTKAINCVITYKVNGKSYVSNSSGVVLVTGVTGVHTVTATASDYTFESASVDFSRGLGITGRYSHTLIGIAKSVSQPSTSTPSTSNTTTSTSTPSTSSTATSNSTASTETKVEEPVEEIEEEVEVEVEEVVEEVVEEEIEEVVEGVVDNTNNNILYAILFGGILVVSIASYYTYKKVKKSKLDDGETLVDNDESLEEATDEMVEPLEINTEEDEV